MSSPSVAASAPLEKQERFITRQLARVERRLRWLDGWTALLLFLAGVLTAVLLLVSADLYFEFPAAVRRGVVIVLGVLALGYIAGCLWLFWAWRINPYYTARQLEKSLEQPHGSLINWLDLHEQHLPPVIRFNLSTQAVRDLRRVDVEQVCRSRRHLLLGLFLVLVLAGWLVLFFQQSSRFGALLARNLLPLAEQPLPPRTTLQLLEPASGNVILPVNHSLAFRARLSGWVPPAHHPQAPHILFRYSLNDSYARLPLDQDREGEWTITFLPDQVQNGFWYRLAAGDAQTPEYQVQVHSLPQVMRFEVTYHYRPYLGLPDRQEYYPNEQAVFPRIRDYRGTQVVLRAKTNCRLRNGLLTLLANGQSHQVPATIPADAPDTLCFSWVLEHSGTFSLFFRDITGESNGDRTAYPVDVLEDRAPVVVLHQPGRDIPLPVGGVLRLEGSATDDWGIKHLRLRLVLVDHQQRQVLADKPYRQGKELRYADGKYPDRVIYKDYLVLDRLPTAEGWPLTLCPGQTLEYWLEAVDACDYPPPGGNVGRSPKYKVLLGSPEQDAGKRQQEQAQAQREQQAHEQQQDQELAQPKPAAQGNSSTGEKKEPSNSSEKSSDKGQSAGRPPTSEPQKGKGQSSSPKEASNRPDQGGTGSKDQATNAGQSAGNHPQESPSGAGPTSANPPSPSAKEGQSAARPPNAGKSETGQGTPAAGGTPKDSQQPAAGQGPASSKSGNEQQPGLSAPPFSPAQRQDFERKFQQLEQVLKGQTGPQNPNQQSAGAASTSSGGKSQSGEQGSRGQSSSARGNTPSTATSQSAGSSSGNQPVSNSGTPPAANGDKSNTQSTQAAPNPNNSGSSSGPATGATGKSPDNAGKATNKSPGTATGNKPAGNASANKPAPSSQKPNEGSSAAKSSSSSASGAECSSCKGGACSGGGSGNSSSGAAASGNAAAGASGTPGQSASNSSGNAGSSGSSSTAGNTAGNSGSKPSGNSAQKSGNAGSANTSKGSSAASNAAGKEAGNMGDSASGKPSASTAAAGSSGQGNGKSTAGSSDKSPGNSASQSKEAASAGQQSGNSGSAGQQSANAGGAGQQSGNTGSAGQQSANAGSAGQNDGQKSADSGSAAGPAPDKSPDGSNAASSNGQASGQGKDGKDGAGQAGQAASSQSGASGNTAGMGKPGALPQQGATSSSAGTGGGRFQDEAVRGSRSDPDLAGRLGNLQLEDLQKKLTPDVLKKLNWTEKEREEFLRQAQAYERWLAQQKRRADADKRQGQGSLLPTEGVRRVAPASPPSAQPLDSRRVPPPPEFSEAYRRFSSQPEGPRPGN
jgi:collagen type III alpha